MGLMQKILVMKLKHFYFVYVTPSRPFSQRVLQSLMHRWLRERVPVLEYICLGSSGSGARAYPRSATSGTQWPAPLLWRSRFSQRYTLL